MSCDRSQDSVGWHHSCENVLHNPFAGFLPRPYRADSLRRRLDYFEVAMFILAAHQLNNLALRAILDNFWGNVADGDANPGTI
jgi:hypothetical protein